MHYPIKMVQDDNNTILVTCPLLPEVTTYGDDPMEAQGHASAAVYTAMADRIANRQIIPLPSEPMSGPFVTLIPLDVLKIELHNAMVSTGVRKADLARKLGFHPPQVDRLLDLDHSSQLDQMQQALAALGRTIEVRVRAA